MKKIKTILDGKLLMNQTWPNSTLNDCMMPNTVMVSSISRGQEGIKKRLWKILQNSYENMCNANLFFFRRVEIHDLQLYLKGLICSFAFHDFLENMVKFYWQVFL